MSKNEMETSDEISTVSRTPDYKNYSMPPSHERFRKSYSILKSLPEVIPSQEVIDNVVRRMIDDGG